MPDNTPHVPTDITRAEVTALISFGTTHEDVATYLEISNDTLTKYYRKEIDTACTKSNAMVAKGLFNKATKQDDLQAQIFWLKCRGRWRTVDKDESKSVSDSLIEKLIEKLID